jgi:D-glycero-D-manno-heptose 1,7-bisphosphate phosphatase
MPRAGRRPAAFLDRDGTIIVEHEYLADAERVELVPGTVQALRRLKERGYALIVVTNQSGIARGLYSESDFKAVQARLEALLAREGVHFDGVYYCPHHPDFTGPCDCRKPGLGMYRQAAAEHDLDLSRSFFIGDRRKDVQPAQSFGGVAILVRTGYGAQEAAHVAADVRVADDLLHAVEIVLESRADD